MLPADELQNDSLKTGPTLISLMPFLVDVREGHHFIYNRSVQKAAESLGWEFVAAVPETIKNNLPTGWCKCLPHSDMLKKDVFSKIEAGCLCARSFYRLLRKDVIPKSSSQVIFIEGFFTLHLVALACALLLVPRESISVWLLYRYSPSMFGRVKWKVFKFLNGVIRQILKPGRFHLLTDSDVLAKSLSAFFKQPLTVVPVPHIDVFSNELLSKSSQEIVCWWPGLPGVMKGWDIIRRITGLREENACEFCLVAAESSNIRAVPGGVKVRLIEDFLSRSAYLEQMSKSDIILLPYNSDSYGERTSGIFVECITAGRIPVVTEGTWMAKELKRYNLEELIVDWSSSGILNKLREMANDRVIKSKILKMQKSYLCFHGEKNFANTMEMLVRDEVLVS